MKRLVRNAGIESEKYFVQWDAVDGHSEKLFDTPQEANDYFIEQTSQDPGYDGTKMKSLVDNSGRKFSIGKAVVGTCDVCNKSNKSLLNIQDVDSSAEVECCVECYDEYECGGWDFEDGKVVKNKYEFEY